MTFSGISWSYFTTFSLNNSTWFHFLWHIIIFYGHWNLRSLCRFLLVIHTVLDPKYFGPQHFLDPKYFWTYILWTDTFFWTKKSFWPKFFCTQIFFLANIFFYTNMFLSQNYFEPKIYCGPKYFFGLKKNFGPNIFWPNIFIDQKFFLPKFLLDPIFVWSKMFGPNTFVFKNTLLDQRSDWSGFLI